MNFTKNSWNGKDGICKKSKWARKCNLSWDGITNNNNNYNCKDNYDDINNVYIEYKNIDYDNQGDIKSRDGSIDMCKLECDNTDGCNGFFYNNENKCYLKNVTKKASPSFTNNGSLYIKST